MQLTSYTQDQKHSLTRPYSIVYTVGYDAYGMCNSLPESNIRMNSNIRMTFISNRYILIIVTEQFCYIGESVKLHEVACKQ